MTPFRSATHARLLAFLAVALVPLVVLAVQEQPGPDHPPIAATDGSIVLDWSRSYWRYHLTFRAPRYSASVKDLRSPGEYLSYERGWHINPMLGRVTSADAPADWVAPAFDDSTWPRERRPEVGSEGWSYDPVVQVKRLRGTFTVADPVRVSVLGLEIDYVGGVVVYLNGEEVVRQHLPSGPLTADVLAEGYPKEAYLESGAKWMMGHEGNEERRPTPQALALRWRRLTVSPPTKLLRKGVNVLAVSLHQSGYHPLAGGWSWSCGGMGGNTSTWPHLALRTLKLTAGPVGSIPAATRPPDVQVWVEDVHRTVVNRDFGETAGVPPVLRFVGARNGAYSGQVVVGTVAPLDGLTAVISDLVQQGGTGKISAQAVRVRYAVGTPLTQLRGRRDESSYFNAPARRLLERYGPGFKSANERREPGKELLTEAATLAAFDHLAERPPARVPADSCQPVWVTVRVPKETPPGDYTGTLTLRAGGAHKIPVRFRVFDVTLPDGPDYSSFIGLQQSLWGPCVQYQVEPWSAKHWAHLERTARQLAEVGNDLAILPLVCDGEAGNADSLVSWVRKGEGHDYDWTNLDRYLDLVAKHWGKRVAVVGEICWAPYTEKGWVLKHSAVTVIDKGRKDRLTLPVAGSEEWAKLFLPFAKAVQERVKAKGFESFHWGWFYDGVPEELKSAAKRLTEECPGVGWARSSHDGNTNRPFPKQTGARVTLDMHIRGFPVSYTRTGEPESRQGWKQSGNVLFPRHASEIQAVGAWDSPMSMRWLVENCLVNGASGVGRLGADYWPPSGFANWYQPFVHRLLHPGPDGAEGGVRFEAFREGVQEAELRILLERAGKDREEQARAVLDQRIRLLWAVPAGPMYPLLGEYYGGWQERSWDLHAVASGVAPARDKQRFFGRGE